MSQAGPAAAPAQAAAPFDVERVRRDFPQLARQIGGRPLVYLDSAATAQKPQAVLDAVTRYYSTSCSNVHRGVYGLAAEATAAYEGARATVARFLGAAVPEEVVFTRGTTEAINLVARSFARPRLEAGDTVVVTTMEHHSNIVPWQIVCQEAGARVVAAPIDDDGEVILDELERLLAAGGVKMAAFVHVSNALGTVNPAEEMVAMARRHGVPVLLDGAQAVPHQPVDVAALDCDFYAFSGHKVYGPTGIGALWAKSEHLAAMPPYQGGGEMIRSVRFEGTTYAPPPQRFEAGTPNIAGAIGLAAALDYIDALGREAAAAYEAELVAAAAEAMAAAPGVRLVGTPRHRAGAVSFVMDCAHPHDIGTLLDGEGIAVRAGHHCAQPVMERFAVPATTRASFAFYNTRAEVDALVAGLEKVRELFG
jgi:cysteine desulfurase/selenocysteine lyase